MATLTCIAALAESRMVKDDSDMRALVVGVEMLLQWTRNMLDRVLRNRKVEVETSRRESGYKSVNTTPTTTGVTAFNLDWGLLSASARGDAKDVEAMDVDEEEGGGPTTQAASHVWDDECCATWLQNIRACFAILKSTLASKVCVINLAAATVSCGGRSSVQPREGVVDTEAAVQMNGRRC